MDVADDMTALFISGDPARGDAATFVRDMQIRLQLGKAKAWDDEQKIWFMIDKCESDLKDGLAQLESTLQGAPGDKVLGFGTKDAFRHFCAWFIKEFTRGDVSSNAEAMLTDSFTQTSDLNKHLKLFAGICNTIDRSKTKDEQLSVREKVNLLINSLARENDDGMGECDSLWQAAKIRHAETPFKDMDILVAWLKEKERGLIKKADIRECPQYFKLAPSRMRKSKSRKADRVSAIMQHDEQIDAYLKIAGECANRACDKLEMKQSAEMTELRSEMSEVKAMLERMEAQNKETAENQRQAGMRSMRQFQPKGKGRRGYDNSTSYNQRPGHWGKPHAAPPRGGRRFDPSRGSPSNRGAGPAGGCYTCGGPHFERDCQMVLDGNRPGTIAGVTAIEASLAGGGPHSSEELTERFSSLDEAAEYCRMCSVGNSSNVMNEDEPGARLMGRSKPTMPTQVAAAARTVTTSMTTDQVDREPERWRQRTAERESERAVTAHPHSTERERAVTAHPSQCQSVQQSVPVNAARMDQKEMVRRQHEIPKGEVQDAAKVMRTRRLLSDQQFANRWDRLIADTALRDKKRWAKNVRKRLHARKRLAASLWHEERGTLSAAKDEATALQAEADRLRELYSGDGHKRTIQRRIAGVKAASVGASLAGVTGTVNCGGTLRKSFNPRPKSTDETVQLHNSSRRKQAAYAALLLVLLATSLLGDEHSTLFQLVCITCIAVMWALKPQLTSALSMLMIFGFTKDYEYWDRAAHGWRILGSEVHCVIFATIATVTLVKLYAVCVAGVGVAKRFREGRSKKREYIAAVRKRFFSTYVEIVLMDDPQQKVIRVLLDTGASLSMFGLRHLRRAGVSLGLLRPSGVIPIDASGGEMPGMKGKMPVKFRFVSDEHGTPYELPFEVCDNLQMPDIIGIDFWKPIGAVIDYGRDTVSWVNEANGKTITLRTHSTVDDERLDTIARLSQSLHLPPRSRTEHKVKCHLEGIDAEQVRWNQSIFWDPMVVPVENNNSLTGTDEHDLQPAFCTEPAWINPEIELVKDRFTATVSRVFSNPTDEDMWLLPGRAVARVTEYDRNRGDSFEIGTRETIARVSEEKMKPSTPAPKNERVAVNAFEPETELPDGDWRTALLNDPIKLMARMMQVKGYAAFSAWEDKNSKSLNYGKGTTAEQQLMIRKLLFCFEAIIAENPKCPKISKLVECRLHFKTANPQPKVRSLPHLSPKDKALHHEHCHSMLMNGVTEFADSEWSTGIVMAAKKGTSDKRAAVDYRGVNEDLVGNAQGVPRMDDLLESLSKASWFSTYDLASAFWSIPMRPQDKKYTAFHGYYDGSFQQFQFRVMPFGLKPSSQIFQNYYQRVMKGLLGTVERVKLKPGEKPPPGSVKVGEYRLKLVDGIVKVYIDDGVTHTNSEDFMDHLTDLTKVFVRLEANGLTLKISKGIWATKELPILGHVVKAGVGLLPDPEKVKALTTMAPPDTVAVLKSLLGASGFLTKFLPEYSHHAKVLREMEKYPDSDQDKPGTTVITDEWDVRRLRSFKAIQLGLTTAPALVAPRFDRPWIILTDCSNYAMGACLAQKDDDGIERPVAYASGALSTAMKNYSISDKEATALVWAVRKWRHFLHGSSAVCLTDHKCLKNLVKDKIFNNERLNRYAVDLSEHTLEIMFRAGKDHHIPDLLSRLREASPEETRRIAKQLQGHTAEAVEQTSCSISDLLYPNAHQDRLQTAVSEARSEDGLGIDEVLLKLADREQADSVLKVDEVDSRAFEFYSHVAGIKSIEPDDDYDSQEDEAETDENRITLEDIRTAQANDRQSQQLMQYLKSKGEALPSDELEIMWILRLAPQYALSTEDVLVKLRPDATLGDARLPCKPAIHVPPSLRSKVIRLTHEEKGHAGTNRTFWAVKERFDWAGMRADIGSYLSVCGPCQRNAAAPSKAPLAGHVTADRCAQKVCIDVLHLSRHDSKAAGYLLMVIDVYSRYATGIPLVDLKSATVAKALRDDVFKNGWGKPEELVYDGASYFKAEVLAGMQAWGTLVRSSAPRHAESHGIIERYNRTYTSTIKHFGNPANWKENYAAAFEANNFSVTKAISTAEHMLYPMQLWAPGRTTGTDRLPELVADNEELDPKYADHYQKILQQQEKLKGWILLAKKEYERKMEATKTNQGRTLRALQIGDKVNRKIFYAENTKAKLSDNYGGPYTVTKADGTGVNFTIKRDGSSEPEVMVHIDHLRKYNPVPSTQPNLDRQGKKAAKKHSRRWVVDKIMSEKQCRNGSTRQLQYLIKWSGQDDEGADYSCSWEPAENLECPEKIGEWQQLRLRQKSERLKEARKIGVQAAIRLDPLVAHVAQLKKNVQLITKDLSECRKAQMIREICTEAGISMDEVLLVWASPPCETYTCLDWTNIWRGCNARDHSDPTKPPRNDDSKYAMKARKHDAMTENLTHSIIADHAAGDTYDAALENPLGNLRKRPFMNSPEWSALMDMHVVDYCAMRAPFRKRENVWVTGLTNWEPAGTTGDGRCHNKCGQQTNSTVSSTDSAGRIRTRTVHRHTEQVQGQPAFRKSAVPQLLLNEIISAALDRNKSVRRTYVIDLFSGSGSMRRAAEAKGLKYIGVDAKHRASITKDPGF